MNGTSARVRSRFAQAQQRFFAEADVGHFLWQTENPYFARTERALLDGVLFQPSDAVLEVGCGEGGNLVNLLADRVSRPRLLVGLDLFERRLGIARKQAVPARLVCGDALALPFQSGSFDVILCRDLLHHLEDPDLALVEVRRVVKPGGRVWVVEPNGRNPLMWLFAMVRPHERGQARNSVGRIRERVGRHFGGVDVEVRQPLPVSRLILHYQYGLPILGHSRAFAALMDAWDGLWRVLWPRSWWAYVIARTGGAGHSARHSGPSEVKPRSCGHSLPCRINSPA